MAAFEPATFVAKNREGIHPSKSTQDISTSGFMPMSWQFAGKLFTVRPAHRAPWSVVSGQLFLVRNIASVGCDRIAPVFFIQHKGKP
jgi:hypothetical protein